MFSGKSCCVYDIHCDLVHACLNGDTHLSVHFWNQNTYFESFQAKLRVLNMNNLLITTSYSFLKLLDNQTMF